MWTEVTLGKWKSNPKTLPQIITIDPEWFFWACEKHVFKGRLALEAERVLRRAQAVRLPLGFRKTHEVCVSFSSDDLRLRSVTITLRGKSSYTCPYEKRSPTLDLSCVREFRSYDKGGASRMLNGFRKIWFSNKNLTKSRIEQFFDDPSNFDLTEDEKKVRRMPGFSSKRHAQRTTTYLI